MITVVVGAFAAAGALPLSRWLRPHAGHYLLRSEIELLETDLRVALAPAGDPGRIVLSEWSACLAKARALGRETTVSDVVALIPDRAALRVSTSTVTVRSAADQKVLANVGASPAAPDRSTTPLAAPDILEVVIDLADYRQRLLRALHEYATDTAPLDDRPEADAVLRRAAGLPPVDPAALEGRVKAWLQRCNTPWARGLVVGVMVTTAVGVTGAVAVVRTNPHPAGQEGAPVTGVPHLRATSEAARAVDPTTPAAQTDVSASKPSARTGRAKPTTVPRTSGELSAPRLTALVPAAGPATTPTIRPRTTPTSRPPAVHPTTPAGRPPSTPATATPTGVAAPSATGTSGPTGSARPTRSAG